MSARDRFGQEIFQQDESVPGLEFIILGDTLASFTFVIKLAIKVAIQPNLKPLVFNVN